MAKMYQKIPGIGTGRGAAQLASRSRLYTAQDHLLIVQSTGYTEEYKRVFFRDIRYVDVRKSKAQLWIGLVSGILLLLFLLLFLTPLPRLAVAVFCLPFAIWFGMNLWRGPACECHVATNVQTLKLPAPRRENKVSPFINFLRTKTPGMTDPARRVA